MKLWHWALVGVGAWYLLGRKAGATTMTPTGDLKADLMPNPYARYGETMEDIKAHMVRLIGGGSATKDDFDVQWVGGKLTVTDRRNNRVVVQGSPDAVLSWSSSMPVRTLPAGPWSGAAVQL